MFERETEAAAARAQAQVDGGIVQGVVDDQVLAFKGIPFAAPPVGPLRWRPPQPVSGWSGIRRAEGYGPDSMQVPFPDDAAPLRVTPREDCLYVNVWRPARLSAHELPVMVWIYGGGFVNGGSSPAVYDGAPFARDGVVLVSFNYRLGNFGFFAHPALTAEQPGRLLGNYAFMDQIAALAWVRRNIAAFGGDPANVTIFGESAGGMSVHVLLTTALASGLFQKAIIESGGGRPGARALRSLAHGPASAESIGLALARRFGIPGQGPEALARLRAIPADELVSGLNMATASRVATYVGGPILDGQLCLGAPTDLYEAGAGARVPVMIGANSLDLGGDERMVEPARAIARSLSARGQAVYAFRFSYVAESLRTTLRGAPHASEIPFVFDTVAARYGSDLTSADATAARTMHRYWAAFASRGKPDVAGEPAWPGYETHTDLIMDFTNHGPVCGPDPWKARLDLVQHASERRERTARLRHQAASRR
ncbi:MAG TPA: carboxylesterase family protein [Steroidobacteraceae bacterium]|nr:carboxylesterase family protein [Steroidobacteraceae bacterium]